MKKEHEKIFDELWEESAKYNFYALAKKIKTADFSDERDKLATIMLLNCHKMHWLKSFLTEPNSLQAGFYRVLQKLNFTTVKVQYETAEELIKTKSYKKQLDELQGRSLEKIEKLFASLPQESKVMPKWVANFAGERAADFIYRSLEDLVSEYYDRPLTITVKPRPEELDQTVEKITLADFIGQPTDYGDEPARSRAGLGMVVALHELGLDAAQKPGESGQINKKDDEND